MLPGTKATNAPPPLPQTLLSALAVEVGSRTCAWVSLCLSSACEGVSPLAGSRSYWPPPEALVAEADQPAGQTSQAGSLIRGHAAKSAGSELSPGVPTSTPPLCLPGSLPVTKKTWAWLVTSEPRDIGPSPLY